MTYALYTSVSTTIFRLFKCQNVQGRWYLTADYRLRCFEGVWYLYASLAIAGIAVYTIGIPLMLFVVLRRNRRYLYESTCPRDQMHRHAEVKRRLGAVYSDYHPDAYYFDLVDMLRRLLLTGGLIILGESSNTQIFLGALICMAWLCLVLAKRPYRALWDNALSVASSSGLLLVILSGMALEIYRLTPRYAQDPYQRHAFGAIMMIASVFVIVSAAGIIFMSIPCVRDRVAAKCARCLHRCRAEGDGELSTASSKSVAHDTSSEVINDDFDVGRGGGQAEERTVQRANPLTVQEQHGKPDTPVAQISRLERLKRFPENGSKLKPAGSRPDEAAVKQQSGIGTNLTTTKKETKEKTGARRFSKFTTDDGKDYFVPEGGRNPTWMLPVGARVAEVYL